MSAHPISVDAQPVSAQAQAELELAERRRRSTDHEAIHMATMGNIAIAVATVVILLPRVSVSMLLIWLGLRVSVSLIRLIHIRHYIQHGCAEQIYRPQYRFGVFVDALCWSALGWWLTPVSNLEVAVVTIGVLISIVALGGAMMYNDMPAARIFLVTILVPNSLYALKRHDDLGVFCFVALLFGLFMFLGEAQRTNRRITELQRLREQANETVNAQAKALTEAQSLNEMKSRFVATMSHEMRTPVHGMLGLLRMARTRVQDTEALRQLDLIRQVGDHLVHVINQVLDFSKMDADALPIHKQAFDLHALVQEVADTWALNCQDKGLHLRLEQDTDASAGMVQGDPIRIRQVLYNLIGNAVKFTSEGGITLRVHRDHESGQVDFSVHDSGIGIPADELHKIFQPFQQAEGTYQRRYGGTGLGLTISRQLCVAMGGDLICQSQVHKGSVFTFVLPLPTAASMPQPASNGLQTVVAMPAKPAPELTRQDGTTPHILLVEDNAVNAIVAEAELGRLGMRVTACGNGREALEWLAHHRADLVLMDCDMPEMDGFEATRRIRELERQNGREAVTIVALTAHGPEVYADLRRKAGMNDHLTKPYSSEEMADMLARHLRIATPVDLQIESTPETV